MNLTVKMDFYDEFRCIADQCSFTCCKGWDIVIDTETLNKWKNDNRQALPFAQNVKTRKCNKKTEYNIKMGAHKCCPFLDNKGLCNIVKVYGDDYLTDTCKTFPRQENSFANRKEYSLSCACPAVVDILNRLDGNLKFKYEGDTNRSDCKSAPYKIRETMITIMQNSGFSLKDRILLNFYMLFSMNKEYVNNEYIYKESMNKESIENVLVERKSTITEDILIKYQDDQYLRSLSDIWEGVKLDEEDSYLETNELFLDMVQNYRNEKNYSSYLGSIQELAENSKIEDILTGWINFKIEFEQYDKLMENSIVSKIFANCVSDDFEEMIISFQMIITEYVMVRYSTFLHGRKDDNILRDYIVVYSRIVGYNAEGIREFWEESFDEAVWEFGYMLLLI